LPTPNIALEQNKIVKQMKINKTGYYILNGILFISIILGFYELIGIKTLVGVLITPAFIISASLRYIGRKKKTADSA